MDFVYTKEKVRGVELSEEKYDQFIDLILNLVDCVVEDGEFTRDCAVYKKHMHESPIEFKRAFYRNFTIASKETISDIMGLVGEYAWLLGQKNGSYVKGKDMKA